METNSAPKITVQKPSDEIVKAANAVEYLSAGGMQIGVKKPNILMQYRIVEIVGESAKNDVYMAMINPILWVAEINGVPEPSPSTKRELEGLIQRLGDEGVVTVAKYLAEKVDASRTEEGSVKN